MKIVYRGTVLETTVISKDGTASKSMVSQMYKMLASMPLDTDGLEKVYQDDLRTKYPTLTPEEVSDMAKKYTAKVTEWADTVGGATHPGVPVPEKGLGYIRPIDVLAAAFHATDISIIKNMLGQAIAEVREALEDAERNNMDARLKELMATNTYKAMMKELQNYDGIIAMAKKRREEVETQLLKWAKDATGSALIVLWGDELRLKTIETADRIVGEGLRGQTPKPQYLQEFPAEFRTTRGDCGPGVIVGVVNKRGEKVVCAVSHNGQSFEATASALSKAPASSAARNAMRMLVEKRGGNPDDVAYNWPRMFGWKRVDGPEPIEGAKEEGES